MINPLWLRTFCTLVECGHFTKTAEQLFMTQSGVSQQIKKLEQQMGCDLLLREGKSFSLTPAGKQLFQQGQEILRALAELSQSVQADPEFAGRVSIASPGSIGLSLYSKLLDYQALHPKLIIDYAFAPNRSVAQSVVERRCDFGLTTELSTQEELVCQAIGSEPLVLVTSSRYPQVDWSSLIQQGFIAHPDARHHSQLLLSANFSEFERYEQLPHHGFSNQISLILEPVSRGLGFTVLPINAVSAFHQPDLLTVHVLPNPVREPLYLCHHRRGALPQRVKTLIEFVVQHCQATDRE